MALRRVLGSSNYSPKFGRLAASNRLFGFGGHERYDFKPTKNRKPEGFDYHMYLGGLGPARFATQEFNKLKNAQLQISRVLRVKGMHFREEFRNSSEFYRRCYMMMLEAVGADGVKLYQTEICVDSIDSNMALQDFCVIDDKKRPIILYHHLDSSVLDFFGYLYSEAKEAKMLCACLLDGAKQHDDRPSVVSCLKLCSIRML